MEGGVCAETAVASASDDQQAGDDDLPTFAITDGSEREPIASQHARSSSIARTLGPAVKTLAIRARRRSRRGVGEVLLSSRG